MKWSALLATILVFRPYFAMLKPVRLQFAGALLFGILFGAAGGFGFPFMAYKVFPMLFGETEPDRWVLIGAILMLPAAFLVRGVSGFANAYLSARCGVFVLNTIKGRLHAKLQHLPLAFFSRHKMGDIMSRLVGDAAAVQLVVTTVFNDLIKQPVTFLGAIGSLAYMAYRNEQLVFILFALGIIPLCVLPVRFLGRKILARAKQLQQNAGNINSMLHENLAAVREIRAFNLQDREIARFRDLLTRQAYFNLKTVKYNQLLTPTIEVITACGVSFAIFYASEMRMELAQVIPLMTALYMTYDPIKKLGGVHNHFKRGQASVERIDLILNTEDGLPDPVQPLAFPAGSVGIAFDEVSFAYGESDVLRGVSVDIVAGSITALVGPSGAGKSTFVNLIPRFYDVKAGAIRIAGVDVRDFAKHDLRSHISIVSQDTVLFNDTIRNNIRLGRLDASDAEVEQAARHAHAHEFITQFDQGYETLAGERGLRLSGGQKQRIAIARAFLKNAPVLIMDEATSSLDSDSESAVQAALDELIRGKTVVIIAHRFSTIKKAGRIVVMEDGLVRAIGTHADLYERDALYRGLYDKQFIA